MNMTATSISISTNLNQTNVNTNDQTETNPQKQNGTFQTVVFSRKTTYTGPDDTTDVQMDKPSPLARLIHQTDRNGKQASLSNISSASISSHSSYLVHAPTSVPLKKIESQNRSIPPAPITSNNSSNNIVSSNQFQTGQTKGLSKFLSNVYSVFGLNNENAQIANSHNINQNHSTSRRTSLKKKQESFKGHIPPLVDGIPRKCLVLDLDETLVHSSFKPTMNPDYIIPVEIDGHVHRVYVSKRPGVDEFMLQMGKLFEIIVYTASLSKYADPLLDQLDAHKVIRHRLFREHCVQHEGTYVKDLSLINRDLSQTIIIDNSPLSYMFHPQNALGCTSFIDDMTDRELPSIMDFLTNINMVHDFREHLHRWSPQDALSYKH